MGFALTDVSCTYICVKCSRRVGGGGGGGRAEAYSVVEKQLLPYYGAGL